MPNTRQKRPTRATIQVERSLRHRLKREAEAGDRSMAYVANKLIREGLERIEAAAAAK